MLKSSLIAASLLVLATGGALAQNDMRAQYQGGYNHYDNWSSPDAFIGNNRFCGPGEIPQPFPNGNGVRCELPNGGYRY